MFDQTRRHIVCCPHSRLAARLPNDVISVLAGPLKRRLAGLICIVHPTGCTTQWRSQKFSTGGASICSIPFCPFPFSCPMRRPITLSNHAPKNYVSYRQGCVRPLRHLYGYATGTTGCGIQPVVRPVVQSAVKCKHRVTVNV